MHHRRGEPKPKNPEPVAPVLNYAGPGSDEQAPKRAGFLRPLIVEVVFLIVGGVMLDGGVMLRIVAVSSLVFWLIAGIGRWQAKYHPTWDDRACFIIGVALAALAPFA